MEFKVGQKKVVVNKPRSLVLAVLCAVAAAFFFYDAGISIQDTAAVSDSIEVDGVKLGMAPGAEIIESGTFFVEHRREPTEGSVDVTKYPQIIRDAIAVVKPVHGVIWSGETKNAMTHTGASEALSCIFKASGCPASGTFYIELFTGGTYARTSTQAGMTELSSGSHPTYSRKQILAATWTCTSNAGSANNCASGNVSWNNVSTDWPAVTGLGLVDASSAGDMWAYSAFSRDLAANDSLTVSYTFTLQSTAD